MPGRIPFPPKGEVNPMLEALGMTRDLPEAVTVPGVLQDVPSALGDTEEMVYGLEDIMRMIMSNQYPEIEASMMKALDEEIFRQLGEAVGPSSGNPMEHLISNSDPSTRMSPEDFTTLASLRYQNEDLGGSANSQYSRRLNELANLYDSGKPVKDTFGHSRLASLLQALNTLRYGRSELTDVGPLLRYVFRESDDVLSNTPMGGYPGGLERYLNNAMTKASPDAETNLSYGRLPDDGGPVQYDQTDIVTPEGRLGSSPPQDEFALTQELDNEMAARISTDPTANASNASEKAMELARLMKMLLEMAGHEQPPIPPNMFDDFTR